MPARNSVEPEDHQDEHGDKDDQDERRGHGSQDVIRKLTKAKKATVTKNTIDEFVKGESVSINFMGWNIKSRTGIQFFKFISVIIPLFPTFALVLYNSVKLESLVTRRNLLFDNFQQLQNAISLSELGFALQDERFHLCFQLLSVKNEQKFNFTGKTPEIFAQTDLAISKLDPWRDNIPVRFFSSRIRFQIRIDDLRELVLSGKGELDDLLGFYNTATDALLNQYGNEARAIKGSSTWRIIMVYVYILRAIDNVHINAAFVIKFYLKGRLDPDEMIEYLRTQSSSQDYLEQASNFSPEVRKKLTEIRKSKNYQGLLKIWSNIEDIRYRFSSNDTTQVQFASKNLYDNLLTYLNNIRDIGVEHLGMLRSQSNDENEQSKWNLYKSIILIVFVLTCVAPIIIFLTVQTTISGEEFLKALTKSSEGILREQRKSEKLILEMLPSTVASSVIKKQKVSFSYDGATVMFCSLYGFADLVVQMDPVKSFQLLNEIYFEFDTIIGNFDVYKVENINEKYMVASGIPKENGNQHASEIARLSIVFVKRMRQLREESSKFPKIHPRIGIHSGYAVAGVIGSKMPRFCLFGETINLASRMESHGVPGRIQISSNTKTLLELTEADGFTIKARGSIEVKGKGEMETFWLTRKSDATMHSDIVP